MTPRLASHVLVGAMLRRVNAAGGHAAVIARGEPNAGAILVICAERGEPSKLIERVASLDGRTVWRTAIEQNLEKSVDFPAYQARRRANDPDLWVIELDIADAERFAAETTAEG